MPSVNLASCTRKSCKECDLGYIIKDHIKTLMQLFDDDLKDYNMQLITSKCLNTAVLVMYMFLGDAGLVITRSCDVPIVETRMKETGNTSVKNFKNFKRSLLNINCKKRYLYYVMMTDATLTYVDNPNKTKQFPGHVFVIEKIPASKTASTKPRYYVYQSYINEYDFKGSIRRNNDSLMLSYDRMQNIADDLEHLFVHGVWDERCVRVWKDLAHVDSTEYLNFVTVNNILFCSKSVPMVHCANNLKRLVNKKLKSLKESENPKAIYNNVTSYYSHDTPLTVGEVVRDVDTMLQKMDSGYIIPDRV